VGALTVAVTALPNLAGAERAVAVLGSALVIYGVLLLAARLLLCRPAPFGALWPAAALGSVTVTLVLSLGPVLLARLVSKAGAVYAASRRAAAPCSPGQPGAGLLGRGRRRLALCGRALDVNAAPADIQPYFRPPGAERIRPPMWSSSSPRSAPAGWAAVTAGVNLARRPRGGAPGFGWRLHRKRPPGTNSFCYGS
jgi:hypothetical protein